MAIKQLPHKTHFYNKLLRTVAYGGIFLIISLGIGVVGYASMILTGMGPVDRAQTDGAKIFSSIYAIYSGVAFLSSVAIIFSPVAHRFLHKFRLEVEDN